jgi:hypothetical protein
MVGEVAEAAGPIARHRNGEPVEALMPDWWNRRPEGPGGALDSGSLRHRTPRPDQRGTTC